MGTMAIPPMQPVPVGFRFQPTDEEVFYYYLMPRNMDQEVHDYSIYLPDIDITTLEPWELEKKYKDRLSYQKNDNEWWFFSARTRNQTARRKTERGKWSSTCADKKIMDGHNDQIMGIMKTFAFHLAQGSSYKRQNWILHEYHLPNLNDVLCPDDKKYFVLCRLNNNKDDRGKNKTGGEVGHSGLFEFDQQDIQQMNGEILSREHQRNRTIDLRALFGDVNQESISQQQHQRNGTIDLRALFGDVNQESISQQQHQRDGTIDLRALFGDVNQESISQQQHQRNGTIHLRALFGDVNQERISQQQHQRTRTIDLGEALCRPVNQESISQQERQRKRTIESGEALFGLVNQESISANLEQQMHPQDCFLSPYQPQIRVVSSNVPQHVELSGNDFSTPNWESSNGSRSSGCVDFNTGILRNSPEDQNVSFDGDFSLVELPWGSSNGSGSSGCANFNENIERNSQDQNVLWYDDELLPTEMLLQDPLASESLEVSTFEPLLRQDGLSRDPSSSAQQNAILLSNQAQSAKSLSGVVPAEEKKISAENGNARPRPLSPLSPPAVCFPATATEPKGFKASNFPASAESFIKLEARSVKEQPRASSPRCKKISSVKFEEDENSAEETTERLRLTLGSIFVTQHQNSLCFPPSKYWANIVISVVLVLLICWQMLHL